MYEINSLSIPMFFNKSNISNLSPVFTEEFFRYLSSFQDLTLYSGLNPKADAVLLGIIDSPKSIRDTISVEDTKFVTTLLTQNDIGDRRDFFTPTRNRVTISLKLVLIKNPSSKDLKAIQANLPSGINANPKIIFNEMVELSGSFDRDIRTFTDGETEGVTNYTNNQGNLRKLIQNLAVQGRDHFRDLVIYAF